MDSDRSSTVDLRKGYPAGRMRSDRAGPRFCTSLTEVPREKGILSPDDSSYAVGGAAASPGVVDRADGGRGEAAAACAQVAGEGSAGGARHGQRQYAAGAARLAGERQGRAELRGGHPGRRGRERPGGGRTEP